ncbi:MAG: DUF4058 family protein [Gemmataceae bacterium]|nr:DUF4058 family protein [Gemmataceae bacterium]
MPLHDWSRVPSGLFHDFHQTWSIFIKSALNGGILPRNLSALVEQRSAPRERRVESSPPADERDTGVVTMERPTTSIVRRTNKHLYAERANRIVVRHHLGRIVAVIEIVSPGNKDGRSAFADFVEKAVEFLRQGIQLLVIDLFPPTPRDPFGVHKAIWDYVIEEDFAFPAGKNRILASYEVGSTRAAYVEPVGVADSLPDMPLFLAEGMHVKAPLERTYLQAWESSTETVRRAVESGVMPEMIEDD